jgi:hypothetical protein
MQRPDLGWYFVYTREAHPAEHLGPHQSFDEKLAAARRLRDEIGITRTILVDDLEGSVHAAYGLLPNMSWVLDRGGTIVYKAMWTSAARIGEFVARRGRGPAGAAQAPFYSEQIEQRPRDDAAFQQGLLRNGARAVDEFARAGRFWAERARAAGRA